MMNLNTDWADAQSPTIMKPVKAMQQRLGFQCWGSQKALTPTYALFGIILLFSLSVNAEEEKKIEMPPLHHVVKVKPPEDMKLPKTFPLNDEGQIDCKTCHGIKDIAKTPINKVDKKADNFHRGGPYKQLTDFCANCHNKKDYKRPNTHKLLNDKGEFDKKDCEYCHKKAPDPKKEIKRDELEFRLPPQKICFGCHLKTPHFNALNHQVKPDKKMRKRMREAEKKLGIILPLDKEGKIMCATCHAPHQPGVIDKKQPAGKQVADADLDKGISYVEHPWNRVFQSDKKARLEKLTQEGGGVHSLGYQRIKTEVLLRLPAKNGALCQACHIFEK